MFRGQKHKRGETARRLVTSLLESTGFVCGSLKDTLSEENVDMEWVGNECSSIKASIGSSTKEPREKLMYMADRVANKGWSACQGNGSEPLSPEAVEGKIPFDDDSFVEDHFMERGKSGKSEREEGTATTENFPKERSGFAKIQIDRSRSLMKDQKVGEETPSDVDAGNVRGQVVESRGIQVVIGLCLSRSDSRLGHPHTVTRQTAFDFNELQDRNYKYVSSTDSSGWLAGGGEKSSENPCQGPSANALRDGARSERIQSEAAAFSDDAESCGACAKLIGQKIAAPDNVHIPVIQINAENELAVDEIISALARGEIFIPHVSILPEALSVNGRSPPDLIVRFDCEKNDDTNPEDWSNWSLEFLHNQLYDCFLPLGAQWTKRPFQITLARKVKWKTVKHMNKFFSHSEQVINTWREKGPQFLQPPDHCLGATHEERTRPHGVYLLRNGIPTNYFAPNFQPPYTSKMTRSLIKNVISKSWDAKRRDWQSEPIPRLRGPVQFIHTVMGCANPDPSTLSPVESATFFDLGQDLRGFDKAHSISKGGDLSPGRLTTGNRMESVENFPTESLLKLALSPRNKYDKKESNVAHFSPSEETFDTATKPSVTTSLEETASHSIVPNPTHTSADDSLEIIDAQGCEASQEENSDEQKVVFDKYSPSFVDVSEDVSMGSNHPMPGLEDHKFDGNLEELSLGSIKLQNFDQQKLNPYIRVIDSRLEKYAKNKSKRREVRDRRQDANTHTSMSSPRRPAPDYHDQPSIPSPSCESNSLSLNYSLDSTFFRATAHTSHTDGGSVHTFGTENQSLLSYVTRSTKYETEVSNIDADDISLSILESESFAIPTDEELMAIGWSKALDSKSGCYYYFTLDRSKTVWENPLAPTQSL